MGLFDKKFCDVCGEKIGLLGNRKLEDGNLCKDCAKKLSPFFDERRHSTVEQIKQQLAYRELNKQALARFSPNITLGETRKIYIDSSAANFIVTCYSPGNWDDENPDVMKISSIRSINLDIDEHKEEIFAKGADGQRQRYNPPRYKYTYDFDLKFIVDHEFFDDFTVRVNRSRVEGTGMEYNRCNRKAMEIINALKPVPSAVAMNAGMPMNVAGTSNFVRAGAAEQPAQGGWKCACGANASGNFCLECGAKKPADDGWKCACGAVNMGKFCPECGAKKPAGVPVYQCDKCGWKPADPSSAPKFCPECGDVFDEADIK